MRQQRVEHARLGGGIQRRCAFVKDENIRRKQDRASDAEAKRLATTQQMSFTIMFRNARGLSQPPIDDIETYWTPMEKAQVAQMLGCSIVGDVDAVRAGVASLVEQTAADELMIVSDIFDHTARLHSYDLIAQAMR